MLVFWYFSLFFKKVRIISLKSDTQIKFRFQTNCNAGNSMLNFQKSWIRFQFSQQSKEFSSNTNISKECTLSDWFIYIFYWNLLYPISMMPCSFLDRYHDQVYLWPYLKTMLFWDNKTVDLSTVLCDIASDSSTDSLYIMCYTVWTANQW